MAEPPVGGGGGGENGIFNNHHTVDADVPCEGNKTVAAHRTVDACGVYFHLHHRLFLVYRSLVPQGWTRAPPSLRAGGATGAAEAGRRFPLPAAALPHTSVRRPRLPI